VRLKNAWLAKPATCWNSSG